ncbi:MAG: FCD domain-containing protein [Proteobacteria bacterium]|nr:FCD domain-containing protein [Pseudomonadota bacterium]
MNQIVQSKTLAARAYQDIRRDIVDGVLPAGSKLRMEALSKRYDVGLTPLREALARLVGDSMVVTEGQRGFWVAPLSIEELEDISNVRSLIETEALTRSIERGDDEWEQQLTAAFEDLTRIETGLGGNPSDEQMHDWEAVNRRFHEILVSACGSPWLIKLRDTMYRQAERYRHISLMTSHEDRCLHDEHEGIYHAAVNRQTLKAARLTELHLNRTAEAVAAALRENRELLKSG